MTNSRHKNPHHPESALADYLQDLLSPATGPDQGAIQGDVGVSAESTEVARAPKRQLPTPIREAVTTRAERKRPASEWAEPPKLDPLAFTPRIQPVAERAPVAKPASSKTRSAPSVIERRSAPAEAPLKPATAPTSVAHDVVAPSETPLPGIRRNRWVEGKPEWAQSPFDCLLFSVSGLKLAVPLVLLGAVHPLDRDLTPLVGRPQWFMGLLTRGDRQTRVVDTARWVMPDRYRVDARAGYGFVIRLDNSEWGLACDEVAQSFRLKPDEVKWRSEDSRRPWLAGTVKSHMCALLDVGEFARMLAMAEKTQKLDLNS